MEKWEKWGFTAGSNLRATLIPGPAGMRIRVQVPERDFPGKDLWPHGTVPGSYCAALRWCRFVCGAVGVSTCESMCCDSQGLCACVCVSLASGVFP